MPSAQCAPSPGPGKECGPRPRTGRRAEFRRTLISVEAAQRWRRARERVAQHHGRQGATAVAAFAKFIGAGARADDRRYVPPRVTGTGLVDCAVFASRCLRVSQTPCDRNSRVFSLRCLFYLRVSQGQRVREREIHIKKGDRGETRIAGDAERRKRACNCAATLRPCDTL